MRVVSAGARFKATVATVTSGLLVTNTACTPRCELPESRGHSDFSHTFATHIMHGVLHKAVNCF